MCSVPLSAHGAKRQFESLYLLYIPGLGEDTVEHPCKERHLVRLGEGNLRRVFPDFYFQEFSGFQAFWKRKLSPGLDFTRNKTVRIQGIIVDMPMYYEVTLEGHEKEKDLWRGEAKIRLFPYARAMQGHLESKWCLQSAPESYVYGRMVDALNHLRNVAKSRRAQLKVTELTTKDDYVEFLRERDWPFPGRTPAWKPIEPRFRQSIAVALEDGRILIRKDGFVPSADVKKGFGKEDALCKIETKVTAHGFPKRGVETLTEDERRLKRLIQQYRPPTTADGVRELANEPKDRRRTLVASLGREIEQFVSEMDYTWEELQFIPGVAFLAEYIASVPQELQQRVAQRYIRDGSRDFFPGKSWDEIARIPNPILLMACLPRMKQLAKNQAQELRQVLKEHGYTLKDLENNKVPGSALMKISRQNSQFNELRRWRMGMDQAEKLAETKRVKELLIISGLKIKEIGEFTIPGLVTKILLHLPSEKAQALVDEMAQMQPYLIRTEDKELKDLIEEKNLKLEVDQTK